MTTLWRDEQAKARMIDWHRRFRALLPEAVESRTVHTSHGETHVLVGGAPDAPPVVLLHGALASSAQVLVELAPLLRRYRVYAVDVLGQSVMSADVRLPVDDDTTGRWLVEVVDALRLPRVALLGISWGGFVAQRFAAIAPERLSTLVLVVPAGLVSGPFWRGFVEMGWPMTRYVLAPSPRSRAGLLAGILTTPDDPDWAPFLGDAFLAANLRGMKVPRLSRPGEFARLTCPVHVIGAERDVSFPGERVVARARELFPTLATAEVLPGVRHSPPTTPEFRESFGGRVSELLRT